MATLRVNAEFVKRQVFASQQYVLFMCHKELTQLAAIVTNAAETYWEFHDVNNEEHRVEFFQLDILANELEAALTSKAKEA
jgi:hypothetical protein